MSAGDSGAATRPFTAFNFEVVITVGDDQKPLCECAFSSVDGLELSTDLTSIREGGHNNRQLHLGGALKPGTLVLKRGMTSSFDLWTWFERAHTDGERHLRAKVTVSMLGARQDAVQARFVLDRCLPTKLRVPGLDAATGQLAIEELTVAYETLRLERPTPSDAGGVPTAPGGGGAR